ARGRAGHRGDAVLFGTRRARGERVRRLAARGAPPRARHLRRRARGVVEAGAGGMIDVARRIGSHDVLFVTLDTLRYDAAVRALEAGRTPGLASLLPGGWERRHTPGSFTYAAHHAFFA